VAELATVKSPGGIGGGIGDRGGISNRPGGGNIGDRGSIGNRPGGGNIGGGNVGNRPAAETSAAVIASVIAVLVAADLIAVASADLEDSTAGPRDPAVAAVLPASVHQEGAVVEVVLVVVDVPVEAAVAVAAEGGKS
jgi:hypothetical protein